MTATKTVKTTKTKTTKTTKAKAEKTPKKTAKTAAPEKSIAAKSSKQLKITLVRSPIGQLPKHRATVRGLGLSRMHQSVNLYDTPHIRGMVNRVHYLLKVEEIG